MRMPRVVWTGMLSFMHSQEKAAPPVVLEGELDSSMARRVRPPTTPVVNPPGTKASPLAAGLTAAETLQDGATRSSAAVIKNQARWPRRCGDGLANVSS